MKIISIILCLLVLFISFSYSDLPVHCEFKQIVGDWRFKLSSQGYPGEVVNYCQFGAQIKPIEELVLKLQTPNIVKDDKGNFGTWTLIYDQGMEIKINSKVYFAFFNYTKTHDKKIISHCYKTFTGTFHDDQPKSKKFGCFQGFKINPSFGPIITSSPSLSSSSLNNNLNQITFKNNETYIKQINKAQNSWIATKYDFLENKKLSDIRRMGGLVWSNKKLNSHFEHVKYMKQFQTPKKNNNIKNYPDNFSWRNVGGLNYVSPVRNQAHCGSCYIFSTMGMFEARTRISTQLKDQKVFSVQEPLDCSVYGQKCEGGFPYLMSKYAYDFGIVEEKCDPYLGKDDVCKNMCSERRFAHEYNYIGGYYGAGNEENMMKEIYENGPIVVNFMVYPDLRHYKTGVYEHVESVSNPEPHFEAVNHAVLCTGFGIDPQSGKKYWEIKNSWSSEWGDKGYFKIVRGIDNCAIESLSTYGLMK